MLSVLVWAGFGNAGLVHAQAVNLIANPSLETANGTVPQDWTSLKTGTNTTTFAYPNSGAQDGTSYAKITITAYTNGNAKWFFTPVAVTAGQKYYFTNYYLSTVLSTTIAEFQDAAGNKTTLTLGSDYASASWKQAAYTFTAPAGAVNVTVYQQLARKGTLQTDNYYLTLATGTLVVKKVVVNTGGGTLTAANFSFSVNGGTAVAFNSTGQNSLTEPVGTYTVTETPAANYKTTYSSCTNVSVRNNLTTTCTITNTYQAGTLTVKKVVVNTGGGTLTAANFSFSVNGGTAVAFNSTGVNSLTEPVGTYTVTETPVANYKTTYSNCTSVSVRNNYTTTCTITNTYQAGTLVVKKVVVNTGGGTLTAAAFSFSVNGGTAVPFNASGQNSLTEPVGTYAVTETPAANYTASFNNCSGVAVAANTTTTCTITNTYVPPTGTLVVNEILDNTGGGYATLANFSFSVNGGTAVPFNSTGQNSLTEPVGTYTVTVPSVTNYATSYSNCNSMSVIADATTTCTITNTYNPSPDNSVPNPSLEQDSGTGLPVSWNKMGLWGSLTPTYTYLTTGHTGNRSVKIEVSNYSSGNAGWEFDFQPITGGKSYLVSDYYQSNINTLVYVAVKDATGTIKFNAIGQAPASTGWAKYSAVFSMPANAVSYMFYQAVEGNGWLITDDYSFTPQVTTGFSRALVSINFDDGRIGNYTNALSLLTAHNFKTTQYIVTESLAGADPSYYMTQSQINAFYALGHEIGSHTVDHSSLTKLSTAKVDQELSESKSTLEALFPPINNFSIPNGDYNASVITEIKKYYRSARTSNLGFNTLSNFDPYGIECQYITYSTTLSDLQSWLAQAAQDKSWLVILYHGVDNPHTSSDGEYSITSQTFSDQLNAITASGLPVVTVQQALDEITPQLPQ